MRADVAVQVAFLSDEDRPRLTERIRRGLMELDVEEVVVDPAAGLVVSLGATPSALRGVAGAIGVWIDHSDRVTAATLDLDDEPLEVTGILTDDQRRAIDRWIARRPTG